MLRPSFRLLSSPKGRLPYALVCPLKLTVGVLAGFRRVVAIEILVGNVESLVALASLACLVEGRRLVKATVRVWIVGVGRVAVRTIAQRAFASTGASGVRGREDASRRCGAIVAHILEYDLALSIARATRVLRRPNGAQFAGYHVLDSSCLVVVVSTIAVTTLKGHGGTMRKG